MFFREEKVVAFHDVKIYDWFELKHKWFCLYAFWNKKETICCQIA